MPRYCNVCWAREVDHGFVCAEGVHVCVCAICAPLCDCCPICRGTGKVIKCFLTAREEPDSEEEPGEIQSEQSGSSRRLPEPPALPLRPMVPPRLSLQRRLRVPRLEAAAAAAEPVGPPPRAHFTAAQINEADDPLRIFLEATAEGEAPLLPPAPPPGVWASPVPFAGGGLLSLPVPPPPLSYQPRPRPSRTRYEYPPATGGGVASSLSRATTHDSMQILRRVFAECDTNIHTQKDLERAQRRVLRLGLCPAMSKDILMVWFRAGREVCYVLHKMTGTPRLSSPLAIKSVEGELAVLDTPQQTRVHWSELFGPQ